MELCSQMLDSSVPDGVVVEPAGREPFRMETKFLLVRVDIEYVINLRLHGGDQLVGGHGEGKCPSGSRRDHLDLHHVVGKPQGSTVVDSIIAQQTVRESCPTVIECLVPGACTQMVPNHVLGAVDGVVGLDRQGEADTSRGPDGDVQVRGGAVGVAVKSTYPGDPPLQVFISPCVLFFL